MPNNQTAWTVVERMQLTLNGVRGLAAPIVRLQA